jgi:two-component system, LuxR family, response regulator FixJ
MTLQSKLALVEDDAAVRLSTAMLLTTSGYPLVQQYASAEALMADLVDGYVPDVIISDVRMPGMSGLELQEELKLRGIAAPLLLITGHGQVAMAVRALKAGAADFIEKPFEEAVLLAAIARALEESSRKTDAARRKADLLARVEQLTPRQKQVMDGVVRGLSSKEIAMELDISPRTVETYRVWIMEKMGATSTAALVRMSIQLEAEV